MSKIIPFQKNAPLNVFSNEYHLKNSEFFQEEESPDFESLKETFNAAYDATFIPAGKNLSLAQCLELLPNNELSIICENYDYDFVPKNPKSEECLKISKLILTRFHEHFLIMCLRRKTILNEIIEASGYFDASNVELDPYEIIYFTMKGLLFPLNIDGKQVVYMPNELLVLIAKYFKDSAKEIEHLFIFNTTVISATVGAINLCGVIPLENLRKLLSKRIDFKIDPEHFNYILAEYSFFDQKISIEDNIAYLSDIHYPDEILKKQNSRVLDYYLPNYDSLLEIYSHDYSPDWHPASHKLKDFLSKHIEDESEVLSELDYIIFCIQDGGVFSEIIEEFQGEYSLSMKDLQEFSAALTHLNNNLNMWELKGHSPNMLHGEKSIFVKTFTSDKVGRNDPCPCGSGKKYKKCCGN